MREINFNNLNSERIMKTETITDHDLSKIAEDWYKGIEHIDTGLKTAFAAGYRFAERQANEHDTGERQLTTPNVIKSAYCCDSPHIHRSDFFTKCLNCGKNW